VQGLIWCLFFNFIGATALFITDGGQVAAWLWASIWMVGGIPGAYILWYSRLYNAAIKDSAFGYALFFAGFFANLGFSVWSAVGACVRVLARGGRGVEWLCRGLAGVLMGCVGVAEAGAMRWVFDTGCGLGLG